MARSKSPRKKPRSTRRSLVYALKETVANLHQWAYSDSQISTVGGHCGGKSNHDEDDLDVNSAIIFENGRTTPYPGMEERGRQKRQSSFLRAFGCSDGNHSNDTQSVELVMDPMTSNNVAGCEAAESEDNSVCTEEDQMRRLGSWGTFGTLATNESMETFRQDPALLLDDDGVPIDRLLLEKQRKKREKLNPKKRTVKFEYPPVSSVKQCPRADPADFERLYFTPEELDLYEDDRRMIGIVDDVEIVAIASSLSVEDVPAPPQDDVASIEEESASILAQKTQNRLSKYISTPRRKALTEQHEGRGRQLMKERVSQKEFESNLGKSAFSFGEKTDEKKVKEKRMLKSVQIFLRERSTGKV